MKKLIASILALTLATGLCACDNDKPETDETTATSGNTQLEIPQGDNFRDTFDDIEIVIPNEDSDDTMPSAPTEEENRTLVNYSVYVRNIEDYYAGNGCELECEETGKELRGAEAASYACKKLLEMDLAVVEKYKDTPYIKEYESYGLTESALDYKQVLARITTIENVLLKETGTGKDKLGNTYPICYGLWEYDKNGNVIQPFTGNDLISIMNMDTLDAAFLRNLKYERAEYIYDANGRVEATRLIDEYGSIAYIISHTYDANGNKIQDTIACQYSIEDDQIFYTYDSSNRLSQVKWIIDDYRNYTINYTYDHNSNVTDIEILKYEFHNTRYHSQYVYDDNGQLVSGVFTYHDFDYKNRLNKERKDVYTFTSDDQGRIATVDISYGHTMRVSGSTPVIFEAVTTISASCQFIYGNYYVYTPAEA